MRRTVESREGETRTETFKALQAVRLGIVVGMWESHIHGEGP